MTQPQNNKVTKTAANQAGPGRPARPSAPQGNEAFEKEVDEELQREWMSQFWEKYSLYILAGALAIVLGVGGYKFMQSRRLAASEAAGARYTAASKLMGDTQTDAGIAALADVTKTGGGYATLAQLRLAAADVATGKPADAVAKYDALTRFSGTDPVLADFARLQSAMLQLDTAPWGDLQARVTGLLGDTNPWRFGARELLGMAALKANNRGEARKQFETLIGDPGVPAGIAERARIVMGSIAAAELAEQTPVVPVAPAAATPTTPPAAPAPPAGAPAATPPAVAPPAGTPPGKKK
jgi:hypothetical protein